MNSLEETLQIGLRRPSVRFDGNVVDIVEAKTLTLGPQNVLTQAERYSRGAVINGYDFAGFRVPFPYSTNGEVRRARDQ
jgi:type I restriction enzyme R subunit